MSYQLSTRVPFCPQMLKLIYLFSIFADKPGGQRSAGAPSFIIQEEFDRYTGYWWQPKTKQFEGEYIHVLWLLVIIMIIILSVLLCSSVQSWWCTKVHNNNIIPTRYKVSKWLWCFWFLTIKLPFTSSTKFIFLQTSLGVRGQLEHPPLSYERSLIATLDTGGNQRQKKVSTYIHCNVVNY